MRPGEGGSGTGPGKWGMQGRMFSLDNHRKIGAFALLAFLSLFVIVLVAGNLVASHSIEHILKKSAISRSQEWGRHISQDYDNLGDILAGSIKMPRLKEHLRKEARYYNITEFTLIGTHGNVALHEILVKDAAPASRKGAARIVQAQALGPEAETAAGDKTATVAIHNRRGKTIGHLQVRMDVSTLRGSLQQSSRRILLISLGALLLMGFAAWFAYFQISSDARRRISRMAGEDQVTGLPTRHGFLGSFEEKLAKAENDGRMLVYMHVKVDAFGKITSTYGFDAADEVLCAVARRLRGIAGSDGLVCRLDGEEFALVTVVRAEVDALIIGERIVASLRKPVFWQDRLLQITVSVGAVTYPHDGLSATRLERRAALVSWAAVSEGGDRLRFYDPKLEEQHRENDRLEKLLKEAAGKGGFELHFQPLVNLACGHLYGFEALIRLPGDDGGVIPPDVFIGMAERLGLMEEVGGFALREGCKVAADWPEHLKVAINLSPTQFQSGRLVRMVRQALDDSGLDARRLEVEVTENLMLDDSPFIHEQLKALQKMGVHIVLDDFGTGYSSLNYLWQFPFDKLKIDRAFVSAIETSEQARSILRAMLVMARALDIPVVAEGIETREQAQWLRKLRCETGQGYLFGRPAPATEVAAMVLEDWRKRKLPDGAPRREPAKVVRLKTGRGS